MIYFLAGPLLILSSLPQTYRLFKTKSSKDISILTYMLTYFGIAILWVRALEIGDSVIIWGQGLSMIFTAINLILIIKYRYA